MTPLERFEKADAELVTILTRMKLQATRQCIRAAESLSVPALRAIIASKMVRLGPVQTPRLDRQKAEAAAAPSTRARTFRPYQPTGPRVQARKKKALVSA